MKAGGLTSFERKSEPIRMAGQFSNRKANASGRLGTYLTSRGQMLKRSDTFVIDTFDGFCVVICHKGNLNKQFDK